MGPEPPLNRSFDPLALDVDNFDLSFTTAPRLSTTLEEQSQSQSQSQPHSLFTQCWC